MPLPHTAGRGLQLPPLVADPQRRGGVTSDVGIDPEPPPRSGFPKSLFLFGCVSFSVLSALSPLPQITRAIPDTNPAERRPEATPVDAVLRREACEPPRIGPDTRMVEVCNATYDEYEPKHTAPTSAYQIEDRMTRFVFHCLWRGAEGAAPAR